MPGSHDHKDGLIDRYLNHRLSDAERAVFEQMLLEDEQLFARVQLLNAFKQSLNAESAALKVERARPALPFAAWLRQPPSLAAAALIVTLGAALAYEPRSSGAAAGALAIDSMFVLKALRDRPLPTLSGAPPYLFQVYAGPHAANAPVALTLSTAAGDELRRVEELPVDAHGWARVVFNEPLSGDYVLALAPLAHPEAVGTYAFTIND